MRFTKFSGVLLLALAASTAGLTTAHGATLFDNSNILTGTGNGLNGANTSSLTSPNTTYGAGINGAGGTVFAADDFTLTTAAQLTLVTFDAYSTSTYPSPPTSPFTGATVNIWSAQPGTAGAAILFTSTTLSATAWTGIYRVLSTTLTNAQRPVMSLSVSFSGVNLAAGTYWAALSVTGIVAPGTTASCFTPPVMNANGTLPAGNGIVSTDGGVTWAGAVDAGSSVNVGIPLTITGNAVPEPGPLVWLSLAGVGTLLVVRRRRAVA